MVVQIILQNNAVSHYNLPKVTTNANAYNREPNQSVRI